MKVALVLLACIVEIAMGHFVEGATWHQSAVLLPTDITGQPNSFGSSAALSGNTVFIGAGSDSDLASSAGAAYVFEKNSAGKWLQTAKLHASDPMVDEHFGNSVAIQGDTAVVTSNGANASAYIFERNAAGDWNQIAKLRPTTLVGNEQFGRRVALHDNHVVVTSQIYATELIGVDGAGIRTYRTIKDTGAAYVFEKGASNDWSQIAVLHSPQLQPLDEFGYSVDISANSVALSGLSSTDSLGFGQGNVFLYPLNAHPGFEPVAEVGPFSTFFPEPLSVAVANGTLAVGNTYVPNAELPVYRESASEWQYSAGLQSTHLIPGPFFASINYEHVATDGNRVIGASGGYVSIFEPILGNDWQEVEAFQTSSLVWFSDVAIDGSIAIAADLYGGVHVFEADVPEPSTPWLAIATSIFVCARRRR